MSLLDFLTSDEAALGLGLMAAGGRTTDPNAAGFGASLARGVGNVQAQKTARLQNQLLQSQIAENTAQAQQRQGALARQQAQDTYYMGAGFGGGTAGTASGTVASPGSVPGAGGAGGDGLAPGAVLKQAAGMPADKAPPSEGKFAAWSKAYNIPVDALVADYFSNGGKGIADMLFKAGRPDMTTVDGYTFDKNKPRADGFTPGITTTANGTSVLRIPDASAPGGVRIAAPQGAMATAGAYADQQARTNATYQPGRPVIGENGRMMPQSQLAEVGLAGAPPAMGAPTGGPPLIGPGAGAVRQDPRNYITTAGAGAPAYAAANNPPRDMGQVAGEQLQVLRNELKNPPPNMPADYIPGLQREIARLNGGIIEPAGNAPLIGPGAGRGSVNPGAPMTAPAAQAAAPAMAAGGVEFSPAEKAAAAAEQAAKVTAATEAAKNAATNLNAPNDARNAAAKKLAEGQAATRVDQMAAAPQKALAAADAIALIDKTLAQPGLDSALGLTGKVMGRIPGTSAFDAKQYIEQIGGTAFLTAYQQLRGTGSISEKEGDQARASVARLSTAQSPAAFREALKDYRSILERGRSNAEAQGRGDSVPSTDAPKAQTFQALPSASQYKGKSVRDTSTGKMLRSDGMSWRPVE